MTEHEREKVIKGLESEVEYAKNLDQDWIDCVEVSLLKGALELLKAQEPRVMTLEELFVSENTAVYLERKLQKKYSEICVAIITKTVQGYILGNVYHTCRAQKTSEIWFGNEYNVRWRCWTSRPTDKQRAETPWEGRWRENG